MSAELLQEAAALMRERAKACPDWNATWGENAARDCFEGMDFAQHIASWHPAVALAVAEWLDTEAAELQAAGETSIYGSGIADFILDGGGDVAPSLAVARAYLGDQP